MRQLSLVDELVIDLFAGGGGASLGIEQALGRSVDYAVNHDKEAIAMHEANHPGTIHYQSDVFEVDPREVTHGRPVGLLWMSPDCKHFSKAKGAALLDKKIRGLCWVGLKWAAMVRPRVIFMENVEEFQTYGPLLADGTPDPDQKGKFFLSFLQAWRRLGYQLEHRELVAYEYGTPTTRKRFFLIARCDGQPIVWPAKTHGKPTDKRVISGELLPWRTAAECIEWGLPSESIFDRKKPLVASTMRRIAKGIQKYVIEAKEPFIVTCNHGGEGFRGNGINQPFKTVTSARDAHGLVVPTLIQTGWGERNGQSPRVPGLEKPHGVVMAEGIKTALVCYHLSHFRDAPGGKPRDVSLDAPTPAITAGGITLSLQAANLIKQYSGNYDAGGVGANEPFHTVTEKDHHRLVSANLVRMFGTSNGASCVEPLGTICTQGGGKSYLVESFLQTYNGNGGTHSISDPMNTVTTRDRLSLISLAGIHFQIDDILMRMLKPRELFRAQGFPDSYIIDPLIPRGKKGELKALSQSAQVRMCGNSVPPQFSYHLVMANYAERKARKRA